MQRRKTRCNNRKKKKKAKRHSPHNRRHMSVYNTVCVYSVYSVYVCFVCPVQRVFDNKLTDDATPLTTLSRIVVPARGCRRGRGTHRVYRCVFTSGFFFFFDRFLLISIITIITIIIIIYAGRAREFIKIYNIRVCIVCSCTSVRVWCICVGPVPEVLPIYYGTKAYISLSFSTTPVTYVPPPRRWAL